MKYLANDFSIELPEPAFEDQTNHVFEVKLREGEVAGLVVMRRRLPEGQTLREAIQARILEEAKRFSGYSVLGEREATVAAGPVFEVRARWRHDTRTIYQRQAHLLDGGVWMILAMRTPFGDSALCDRWMDDIVGSLELRGG
ncbi:MAG TPA: DcrB-related protein [Byssovorax sp.]